MVADPAGKPFTFTAKQIEARGMLAGPAKHIMLFGGARSGKTFLICQAIAARALRVTCQHAILRHRFNHLKASIIMDTWPKMMRLCFPGVPWRLDKTDWYIELPTSGSLVWCGGLDDKERTEKILGQEHCGIFLTECSEIAYSSRLIAVTRLAQNVGLPLKMYHDCNPPLTTHWTHRLFIEKIDPTSTVKARLQNPEDYASMQMNPIHNAENLPESYLRELRNMPSRDRIRFWEGRFGSAVDGALWMPDTIDRSRIVDPVMVPDLIRIVVGVDPSGTSGMPGEKSDLVGIVVAGLGSDGNAYVLSDASQSGSPEQWGRAVSLAYHAHEGDLVVGETNFGGDMVRMVVRTADPVIPFKAVKASRASGGGSGKGGKVIRAEPIASLYEQGKVRHVGLHSELEDQMCSFTTGGYMGSGSPDRVDALVWALTELFPQITRKVGSSILSPRANVGHAAVKSRPGLNQGYGWSGGRLPSRYAGNSAGKRH